MFDALAEYQNNGKPAIVYRFSPKDTEYDAETAKHTFLQTFGQEFYDRIAARPQTPVACAGEDMACAIYLPTEHAVFVVSRYDFEGQHGAKIHLDAEMNITHVEQKDPWGPFKNGGEYFLYMMRRAAPET